MEPTTALATSISVLAITLPLAAGIWRVRVNGSKVDVSEFVVFKADVAKKLEEIQLDIKSLTVMLTRVLSK